MKKKIKNDPRWELLWFKECTAYKKPDQIIKQKKKHEHIFYFKNLTRQLEIWIRPHDIVITPNYIKYCFDMLCCIYSYSAKSDKEYFSEECTHDPPVY